MSTGKINVRVSNQLWRVGIPEGGTTGQLLTKASATDYDTEWADVSGTFAASGANSDITSLSGLTTPLSVAQGGTSQATAQLAINTLTAVSGATVEHVLTKDTSTGNAIFKEAGGGGAGGPLTLISATTVVPADAVVEFGFTVDKTKIYRMKITHLDFYVASPFSFEASTDGGSSYLTSVCDSATVYGTSTSGVATAVLDRVHLANTGRIGTQMGGSSQEVEVELFWHNGFWNLKFEAGGYRTGSYCRHGMGHGSIVDTTGAVNFINFVTTVSGIETAQIYWYEVDYDF